MSPSSPTSSNKLSTAVMEAVAKEMNISSTELPEQLYDVIDPGAMDALFDGNNKINGVVKFTYCGYDVTVTADGDVTLDE